MADRSKFYGLKEVADVELYPVGTQITIKNDGTVTASETATYSFDTLKVTNIEATSEEVSARGGKGNPELISWSYGKEVTFTMEDALLSMETLDLMFGAKEEADGDVATLTIDANTFPEPYLIVGKTVIRAYSDGKDHPFFFVMPKAQIQVGGTLTMEAEGDPSTFEMTIKALSTDCKLGGTDAKDVLVQFINAEKVSEDTGYVINGN